MNNNFSNNNNNSLKEMFNTFSNTPMRTMTNIEPLNIQSNYNEPTYNQSNTGTMKNIIFGIFILKCICEYIDKLGIINLTPTIFLASG